MYAQRSLTAVANDPLIEKSEPFDAPLPFDSRPNVPAPIVKLMPWFSRGDFVMTLITPLSALAPQTADAGPRITSIRLISFVFTGMKSHITKPKKS